MQVDRILALFAFGLATPTGSAQVSWEPYRTSLRDGSELQGQIGRLRVPQRHALPDGPTYELAFVRFPSTASEPGPPIYFLVGGPGASGIEFVGEMALDPAYDLLSHGDVIALDQRGTGRSEPRFDQGPDFEVELPLDRALDRASFVEAQQDAVRRCVEHWRARGVDLGSIQTVESADDVEALRRALGHERIVPFGISYGTHLGLGYLRRHGQHVARAVLLQVEGPDQTHKLPSDGQRFLEELSRAAAAAPELAGAMPDLARSLERVLERLAEEPVRVTTDRFGEPLTVVIGPYDVQLTVAYALSSANTRATLPLAIARMDEGRFEHILGFVLRNRVAAVDSPMGLLTDSASGASPGRLERIRREAADPRVLLGDALDFPLYPEVCSATGVPPLPEEFRQPVACDRPVLLVSGALDARTPPENAECLLPGLGAAVHVVVANSGHDARANESPEFRDLLRRFLAGEPVASTEVALPALAFR